MYCTTKMDPVIHLVSNEKTRTELIPIYVYLLINIDRQHFLFFRFDSRGFLHILQEFDYIAVHVLLTGNMHTFLYL